MKNTNLRKLSWAEVILYFLEIKEKEDFSSKDLLDYFRFLYLSKTGINNWVNPNYKLQTSCAKKVLDLYGRDLSIELIDILFSSYKEIFNKEFEEIKWSLGILSSDKMGWAQEKVFKILSQKSVKSIQNLLLKPRKDWTLEETEYFNDYIKGVKK